MLFRRLVGAAFSPSVDEDPEDPTVERPQQQQEEEQPRQPSEVTVVVRRTPQSKLGLAVHVVLDEDLLLVLGVHPGGLIDTWNKEHPEWKVRRNDWIVSVNGIAGGGSSNFAQLQQEGDLEIVFSRQPPSRLLLRAAEGGEVVSRPQRYSVTLSKEPGMFLGVQLTVGRQGIVIASVSEGLIRDWNSSHNEPQQVRPGDRIVFVNGVPREQMAAELAKCGTFYIVLQRGPAEGRRSPLDESVVESLPRLACCKGDPCFGSSEVCGICLEEWEPGAQALQLPCKHVFHTGCVATWLTQFSPNCPLCGWHAGDLGKDMSFDPETDHGFLEEDAPLIPVYLPSSTIRRATGPYGRPEVEEIEDSGQYCSALSCRF